MSRDNTPWRTARKMYALHRGANDWYRIRNQIQGPTQLHIYDEIGYFGVSASDLIRDLADVQGPLEVHLNSPGGEVNDGIAIYNTLMARKDVTVMIDGIAASIASVIAMAGNPVLVARQGTMMVHDGFTMAIGSAQDMRDAAEQLDRASNNIASIYSDHTGKPVDYWRQIMKAETWFTGQEAIDAGLADRFIDSGAGRPVQPPVDVWDLSAFRGPQTPQPPADPAPPTDPAEPVLSGMVEVKITDSDGHTLIFNWDASSAMSSCHSASDYRSICAGEKTVGEPDQAQHWALPHHTSPGAGPDKGGVIAALGRWNQTQDLKNKDGALSHLKAHASALGLPSGDDSSNQLQNVWLEPTEEEMTSFLAALRGA
jgi:ATP-dependent protease ClpP protease subunit